MKYATLTLLVLLLAGCGLLKPQQGGHSTTSLGGASGPTTVTTAAPENPQTPTTTTVEKTTTREYAPSSEFNVPSSESAQPGTPKPGAVAAPSAVAPVVRPASSLLHETVTERAITSTGAAQKDTSRELSARLSNLRGVLWVGLALLFGGPILGWKMGWFTNGCIAGAVGLLLVILSTVLPGNEAWFGLGGLLLIPLVAYVYYRAHHDATQAAPQVMGPNGPAGPPPPAPTPVKL